MAWLRIRVSAPPALLSTSEPPVPVIRLLKVWEPPEASVRVAAKPCRLSSPVPSLAIRPKVWSLPSSSWPPVLMVTTPEPDSTLWMPPPVPSSSSTPPSTSVPPV